MTTSISGLFFGGQGWICPNCNRVYSPTVLECLACNTPIKTTTRLEDSTGITRKIAADNKMMDSKIASPNEGQEATDEQA